MVVLLIWALATIGLTDILMFSKILDDDHLKVRSWLCKVLGKYKDVLECSVCTGWWSGLLMSTLLAPVTLFSLVSGAYAVAGWWGVVLSATLSLIFWPFYLLGCAFAGAGLMHAYVNIINLIESKTDFIVGDDHDDQPQQPQETTT